MYKLHHITVEAIGKASGELSIALAELTTRMTKEEIALCPTPPYYDLYGVHHAVNREIFFEVTASPLCDSSRDAVNALREEILQLEKNLSFYHSLDMPHVLIHGDLHYDNVLCSDLVVEGLLDFEFVAMDWRAMELAICLTKYAGSFLMMLLLEVKIPSFSCHICINYPCICTKY
jgi:homoserine kinase type II